jgi:hypothetical protein
MASYGYGLSSPRMFGPRQTYTRPTNLARARGLVQREKRARTPAGRSLFGYRFKSSRQVGEAAQNWPSGFAETHGGRNVPETRRDTFLNSLREARGGPAVRPAYRPDLWHRVQRQEGGVYR